MKKNKMHLSMSTLCFALALGSAIGGCIASVLQKNTISELFGVCLFICISLGVFINLIQAIFDKSDL